MPSSSPETRHATTSSSSGQSGSGRNLASLAAAQAARLYHAAMMPVSLVSFLVSLYLVDREWQRHRQGSKGLDGKDDAKEARGDGGSGSSTSNSKGSFYYHSRQRQLMRRQASEAFALRRRALAAAALAIVVLLVCAVGVARVLGRWRMPLMGDAVVSPAGADRAR